VWKTTNNGLDWTRISGDLTKHDPKTLGHSGGPITGDMNGPEIYATVFALAPSKVDVNVLWAGSDDGMIHVTRDGGKSWADVTPKDMPEFGRVSIIDASRADPSTRVSRKACQLDERSPPSPHARFRPNMDADRQRHRSRRLRASSGGSSAQRGAVFGTEHGTYVSFDDGDNWQSW
jgi:photosystem II stability/assembly factor-like uncharacterized protein